MTPSEKQYEEFRELIREIITSEEFCKMKTYKHHLYGSTYDHSIHVAWLCYLHYQKRKCTVELKELIRGALLHDYFLYDRHDKTGDFKICGLVHGFTHPKKAWKNAVNHYPDLTETEQDVIRRHMFPLTPVPPKTRCGWLVCFYDKVAAIQEYCRKDNSHQNYNPQTELQ